MMEAVQSELALEDDALVKLRTLVRYYDVGERSCWLGRSEVTPQNSPHRMKPLILS